MKLRIQFSTSATSNQGINSTNALPVNQQTSIRIEAVGREVRLFCNNALNSTVVLSADRIFGDATLYVANPWDTPATGTISPIAMTSISQFSVLDYRTHTNSDPYLEGPPPKKTIGWAKSPNIFFKFNP